MFTRYYILNVDMYKQFICAVNNVHVATSHSMNVLMSVRQCAYTVFQDIPLIVIRRQTYFVNIYRIQDVVSGTKHLEFGRRGAFLSQCLKKVQVSDVLFHVRFFDSLGSEFGFGRRRNQEGIHF